MANFEQALRGAICILLMPCGCGSSEHGSNFHGSSGTSAVETSGVPTAGETGSTFVGNSGSSSVPDLSNSPLDGGSGVMGSPFGDGGSSTTLTVTIRDFQMYMVGGGMNPDFENATGDDRGIVEVALGKDGKPVYAHPGGTTRTTHGQTYFDQWYHDTPNVNIDVQYPLTLTMVGTGLYGYDSAVSGPNGGWFPIDDGTKYATKFGNQGEPHNYSFTTELHTIFTYTGGETFSFSGDDDVFVFINNALVIDLGGVHVREQGSVSLDMLGLKIGSEYPLDLFDAERHTVESNFSFSTSLALRPAPTTPR